MDKEKRRRLASKMGGDNFPDGGMDLIDGDRGVDDVDTLRLGVGDGLVAAGDALEESVIGFFESVADER